MRILTITHAFPPEGVGGTERYAEVVATGLQERGHEVSVFTGTMEWRERLEVERRELSGLPATLVHRSDLYFDHWDKIFNPHVSRCFEEELERLRPDAVHVHHWIRLSSDLVRRAAARGIPALVHLHDLLVTCPRIFRFDREERSCDEPLGEAACLACVPRWKFQADAEIRASLAFYRDEVQAELAGARALLAPSRSHAAAVERYAALAEGRVTVLPHPRMPGAAVRPGVCADSPAGRLKLLYFSHLHPVKGAHRLLEALHRLGPDSGVEVDFLGGFATEEYETRIRGLAEGLSVRFHGPYAAGEPAATPADAVVISSQARESYSFWLDEAQALGLPILAAAAGALVERAVARTVQFDPADPEDLAARIRELRDDVARRRALAGQPAPEPLGLREHLDALENLFREARGAGPPPVSAPAPLAPLLFEWDRRERGFQELLRSEGWEEVQAELVRRVRALEEGAVGRQNPQAQPRNPERAGPDQAS